MVSVQGLHITVVLEIPPIMLLHDMADTQHGTVMVSMEGVMLHVVSTMVVIQILELLVMLEVLYGQLMHNGKLIQDGEVLMPTDNHGMVTIMYLAIVVPDIIQLIGVQYGLMPVQHNELSIVTAHAVHQHISTSTLRSIDMAILSLLLLGGNN